jgi:AcrR family transcriptional regulator
MANRAGTIAPEEASQDADSTEKRIIEAALELFAAKGFQATGIRDIAEAAGVSSAALYHYMGTKSDLLVRVMVETLTPCLEVVLKACNELDRPESGLVAFVRLHVIASGRYPRQWTVVDNELRSLSGAHRDTALVLRDRIDKVFTDILLAGKRDSVFESTNVALDRLAILEMCNGVVHWYRPDGPSSLDDIADHFAELALAMLRARRAGRVIRVGALRMPPMQYYTQMFVDHFERRWMRT